MVSLRIRLAVKYVYVANCLQHQWGFWGFFVVNWVWIVFFFLFTWTWLYWLILHTLLVAAQDFWVQMHVGKGVILDFGREIQLYPHWAPNTVVQYHPRKQIRINWCPGLFRGVALDSTELEASGHCWQGRSGHICRAQIQLMAKELLRL